MPLIKDEIEKAQDKAEKAQDKTEKTQDKVVTEKEILDLCITPKSIKEIMDYFGYKNSRRFRENYINKLLNENKLIKTLPNKPTSKNQKYVTKN